MIKEKFLLAAGSPTFSRQLAAIFQSEGWQVRVLTNESVARRFINEVQDVPQYLVTDNLSGWIIRLSRELHSQGTQIILSGFMPEPREELETILGVHYYSIMGLPSKVASALLGVQIQDDEIFRRLSHKAEIRMMEGSIFDKGLQEQLELDGLVVFHRRGFHLMNVFTCDYMENPTPELNDKTAVWPLGKDPSEMLIRRKLVEMLSEVVDKGAKVVGISQVAFCDRNGEVIDDHRADEMLLQIVSRYMDGPGALLPIDKIYILIDKRCKSIRPTDSSSSRSEPILRD